MEYTFVYIFLLSLILLGFIFPKSKWVHILLVFVSFSLYTMSYDDWDRLAYMDAYDNASLDLESRFEYLFILFMKLCSGLGLSFESFRYLTAIISLSGLEYASFKLSQYRNIVWAAYLIYPAMFDATLIRTSMSMGIVAVFMVKLIYAQNTRNYIVCFILAIIAALFHKSAFVFLAFVPLGYYMKRGVNRSNFIVFCLMFIILESASAFMFSTLGNKLAGSAANYYENLYQGNIIFNFIMYFIYISPIFLFWPKRVFKSASNRMAIDNNILKINLLFILVLIPQFYIANFSRVFKILFFFNYIYLSRCAEIPRWKVAALPFVFIYPVFLLTVRLVLYPDMIPTIVLMHINTNTLLELFKL